MVNNDTSIGKPVHTRFLNIVLSEYETNCMMLTSAHNYIFLYQIQTKRQNLLLCRSKVWRNCFPFISATVKLFVTMKREKSVKFSSPETEQNIYHSKSECWCGFTLHGKIFVQKRKKTNIKLVMLGYTILRKFGISRKKINSL